MPREMPGTGGAASPAECAAWHAVCGGAGGGDHGRSFHSAFGMIDGMAGHESDEIVMQARRL